ncbi:MAG: hypothetical protein U9M98_03860 [Patescibacteria group bacterium]|nr:hypothetical protein [Patescibacteria group bacterium]
MRRKTSFTCGGIYHIYTRGIDGKVIFPDWSCYEYFTSLMEHCLNYDYPYSSLKQRLKKAQTDMERQLILSQLEEKGISSPVDIFCFSIMPTHPHLIVQQKEVNGVTNFFHRVFTSYSRYFNLRQERKGSLYESAFEAVCVESDQQLIHLSRYQHINQKALGLNTVEELSDYPWSSLSTYLGEREISFVDPDPILSFFSGPEEYADFVSAEIDEYEPLRIAGVAIDDDFGWFARFRALEEARKKELREEFKLL